MHMRLLRLLWRLLTFIIVIASAIGTTFWLVPYLDRRMPVFFAILLAYGIFAYILAVWAFPLRLPLNLSFGTLAGGLGCFPLDTGR